jgi:hypothetical protein
MHRDAAVRRVAFLHVVRRRRVSVRRETARVRGERPFAARLASVRKIAEERDHALTQAEAAVLDAAIEDASTEAGARAGARQGEIAATTSELWFPGGRKLGAWAGRFGGRFGARFGARFVKPQTAETTVEVQCDPDTARERARALIAGSGEVIDDPNAFGDGSVWGIVPSGLKNMSPALVRVQAEVAGSGTSRVHIRATAQEGLITQRVGAEAADRIAEAISHDP